MFGVKLFVKFKDRYRSAPIPPPASAETIAMAAAEKSEPSDHASEGLVARDGTSQPWTGLLLTDSESSDDVEADAAAALTATRRGKARKRVTTTQSGAAAAKRRMGVAMQGQQSPVEGGKRQEVPVEMCDFTSCHIASREINHISPLHMASHHITSYYIASYST